MSIKDALAASAKFLEHLVTDDDHVVEAQVIAFCLIVLFSIYWLHTRMNITSGWATCYCALAGLVALKGFQKR